MSDLLFANLFQLKARGVKSTLLDQILSLEDQEEKVNLKQLRRLELELGVSLSDLLEKEFRPIRSKIKALFMDCDGVLTKGEMFVHTTGEHTKVFNVKDGMGIKRLQEAGLLTGIISAGHSTGVVEGRAKQLDIPLVYVGKSPKLEILSEWMKEHKLNWEEVAYIGDDVNDLAILEKVGAAFCPADAVKSLRRHSGIQVLENKGGEGCIRELVDEYLLNS